MFFFLVMMVALAAADYDDTSYDDTNYDVDLIDVFGASPVYPNGRIVGGQSVDIQSYPYQVSLEYGGRHICGGSIIASHYVVTAAHCVHRVTDTDLLEIRAGTSERGEGGTLHPAEDIVAHEEFSKNRWGIPTHDIALVRVKKAFKFDGTRQPIGLFGPGEKPRAGAMSVITGWGATDHGPTTQLQAVNIPIMSSNLCNSAYKFVDGVPEGQICAAYYKEGGKDACQGDSGGPLTIDGRLAGIVSWGHGCAQPAFPGVYTDISYFHDWINQNMER